jgi:hypothetical protein
MSKYKEGLIHLANQLAENGKVVVLLGGSASYIEADLASIESFPKTVKSPSRQSLTNYVDDVKKIVENSEDDIVIVEDHSLTNGKILFLGEHFPDIDVVSVVGKKPINYMPNCRVLEIEPSEADTLHKKRSTPPADKR